MTRYWTALVEVKGENGYRRSFQFTFPCPNESEARSEAIQRGRYCYLAEHRGHVACTVLYCDPATAR